MEVYELSDGIKALSDEKQNISDYLDIFQFWFRDVLMFKATQEVDNLVFKQEINYIKEQASSVPMRTWKDSGSTGKNKSKASCKR